MGGVKVTTYRLVGLDTAVFIYYFNQHPKFGLKAKAIFAALAENRLKALTSTISLAELLALKASRDKIRQLHQEVLELPNFSFLPVNEAIATQVAIIYSSLAEYSGRQPRDECQAERTPRVRQLPD